MGDYILTSSNDKTARLWNSETGRELHTLKAHLDTVSSVAFSPDGKHVLTGCADGTARLWPLPPQFWPQKQKTTDLLRDAQHP
jgi:WD40 repeat protein